MAGSIRERAPGVWQVRVSLGRDRGTGRYAYASETVHGTKRDAQRAATRLAGQADSGRVTTSTSTLGEFLSHWLTHIEVLGRAPKTMVEHRRIAREISDQLGDVTLRRLRAIDLDGYYGRLARRGLSAASIRRHHAVLSASLHLAERWGLIDRSPARNATPPSVSNHEVSAPTHEQVKYLIELALDRDPQLASLLFVAATTGCRRGELCGLRWSDVDLDGKSLTIRRSISDVSGGLEVRATKTGRVRSLSIDEGTARVLAEQKARSAELAAAAGGVLGADAYVWSQQTEHAVPWRPARVTASFERLRDHAGLPGVRLHHLRHFAATVMQIGDVALGASFETLCDRCPIRHLGLQELGTAS